LQQIMIICQLLAAVPRQLAGQTPRHCCPTAAAASGVRFPGACHLSFWAILVRD
jgi:hypothetical protein